MACQYCDERLLVSQGRHVWAEEDLETGKESLHDEPCGNVEHE